MPDLLVLIATEALIVLVAKFVDWLLPQLRDALAG